MGQRHHRYLVSLSEYSHVLVVSAVLRAGDTSPCEPEDLGSTAHQAVSKHMGTRILVQEHIVAEHTTGTPGLFSHRSPLVILDAETLPVEPYNTKVPVTAAPFHQLRDIVRGYTISSSTVR